MSLRNIVIVAALALAGGFAAYTFWSMQPAPIGAAAGPDHTFAEFFHGGLGYGGGCFATSTTGTLTSSTMAQNSCIRIAATGAGQGTLSITLPATSTMSAALPQNQGACRDWIVDASGVAAATTTTIVAGAGWNLVGLDATGAGTGADVLDGAEYGRLTACRENDSDITGYLQEYIHAD